MQIEIALAKAKRLLGMSALAVAFASPLTTTFAQDAEEEGGEAVEPAAPDEQTTTTTPGPVTPPPAATNLPVPPPPPAAPPSPFSFVIKGFVSGSIMMQDLASASGNYNLFLFGPTRPANAPTDKWFYGGDVRQSQLKFFITGPTLIGAVPMAGFDFDLLGGNQINSVPGAVVPVSAFNAMTMMNSQLGLAPTGTSAQGDENILPRVRLAYLELNWGGGADILRIGQFHNLLVPMIAASLGHIGAPLGYGAGQLGWRAPGLTYQHTFKLTDTTSLAASIQVNRNNWADNVPTCAGTPPTGSPPTATSPTNNCVPNGVSLAEASALPQVQARLMLSGPPKASPFPMYAPNAWQAYVVGVWDQKDASGFGAKAANGATDTLTTAIVEAGFKVGLGPVLLAANGWYGKNAGSAFGHIFTQQHPAAGDITGFGAWGQIGLNLTPELAVWWFTGIDKPKEADIRKTSPTGAGYIQNIQMVAQLSYVVGPLAFSLEYMRIMSDLALPAIAALNLPQSVESASANQIALSGAFFF